MLLCTKSKKCTEPTSVFSCIHLSIAAKKVWIKESLKSPPSPQFHTHEAYYAAEMIASIFYKIHVWCTYKAYYFIENVDKDNSCFMKGKIIRHQQTVIKLYYTILSMSQRDVGGCNVCSKHIFITKIFLSRREFHGQIKKQPLKISSSR